MMSRPGPNYRRMVLIVSGMYLGLVTAGLLLVLAVLHFQDGA
jgi:hypothetical protein